MFYTQKNILKLISPTSGAFKILFHFHVNNNTNVHIRSYSYSPTNKPKTSIYFQIEVLNIKVIMSFR